MAQINLRIQTRVVQFSFFLLCSYLDNVNERAYLGLRHRLLGLLRDYLGLTSVILALLVSGAHSSHITDVDRLVVLRLTPALILSFLRTRIAAL